jgi:uncharacterized repeat protein (TIGR01451 family)
MKRLVIRISALAAVVALGLIAIAQAQRSVGDTKPAAQSSGTSAAPAKQGATQATTATARYAEEPRPFPGDTIANPLRAVSSGPVRDGVLRASGQAPDNGPGVTFAGGSTGSSEGAAETARDPFPSVPATIPGASSPGAAEASVRDAGVAGPAATDPNYQPENGQPAQGQGMNPTVSPAREPGGAVSGKNAYPQLPSATFPDSKPATKRPLAPPESSGTGAITGDRYSARTPMAGGQREPQKLDLDPTVPVTSLPYSAQSNRGLPPARGGGLGPDSVGSTAQGTGTPGGSQLEGPQTPQLTIEKSAPPEIQVGKEATFRVKVANTGRTPAQGVEVRDEVPKGTRLVDASPQASPDTQGRLVWAVGTIQPGEEVTVEMRVMPELEGEIGSVATVSFNAEASARTVATKPELTIKTTAPSQVLIGGQIALTITISNPGSGVATNVVLTEHVPPGLRHPAGDELENVIGDLKPNESRQLELSLEAEAPGVMTNMLSARAEPNLAAEDQVDIEVMAPQLDVALEGPKLRYLDREATYTLSVLNRGTAPAKNVELIAHLPAGLEFVSASNQGSYEASSRSVHWVLEKLPVQSESQQPAAVRVTTMAREAGEQSLRFTCTGEPGLSAESEQTILVEGIADVSFQVVDVDDPIEVGGETTYEIRVVNQGSKAATNVQLVAMVPPGMRATSAEGPSRYAIEPNRVIFESLPRLAEKADTTYRVRVQGLQPGDLRLSVQLLTDGMSAPVTVEENTRVYSDE